MALKLFSRHTIGLAGLVASLGVPYVASQSGIHPSMLPVTAEVPSGFAADLDAVKSAASNATSNFSKDASAFSNDASAAVRSATAQAQSSATDFTNSASNSLSNAAAGARDSIQTRTYPALNVSQSTTSTTADAAGSGSSGSGTSATAVSTAASNASTSSAAASAKPGSAASIKSVEGPAPKSLNEIFRFDISINWIIHRWPRVSSGLAHLDLQGYRVPVVTGTHEDELAGALTYYFDKHQVLERIIFRGTTGNPKKLVTLVTTKFQFEREITDDPSLYLYSVKRHGVAESELRIRPARVIKADAPRSRYEVEVAIKRPTASTTTIHTGTWIWDSW